LFLTGAKFFLPLFPSLRLARLSGSLHIARQGDVEFIDLDSVLRSLRFKLTRRFQFADLPANRVLKRPQLSALKTA
jgi:hypothetical protein